MKKYWSIGILVFDGVDAFDFVGPAEIFSLVRLSKEDVLQMQLSLDQTARKPFDIKYVSENGAPVTASNNLIIQPDFSMDDAPSFDILIVPGGFIKPINRVMGSKKTIQWIINHSHEAQLVASVCTGALLLASAGILNGKKATTNRAALDFMEQKFPEITVVRDSKFVDQGNVITAQGPAAGLNLAFYLVKKLFGEEVARLTANTLEYDGQIL
ncbi:DJ-1/PfpI family protein [Paenibacillus durus]|uniref:DJ-1/PfpI domain-containing protein n=1 Tax=Paenibacillus durus TaxID=44251 RepID=A0A089HPP5_PAEDU|nr:DJ-1/PfpI family protein [Paenibacillus durus]AIQ12343.1 hypothetical protein PDUR_10770 [Paenibacillus durus]